MAAEGDMEDEDQVSASEPEVDDEDDQNNIDAAQ